MELYVITIIEAKTGKVIQDISSNKDIEDIAHMIKVSYKENDVIYTVIKDKVPVSIKIINKED